VNADDIEHAFDEIKRSVFQLALHRDDKEAIVEQMASKMSIWSVALEGHPLQP
jgi:hypothetical protein